nr:putative ribonuclease H-like domain-containing protein [Tanacetum cinerariifolium]
MTGNISYLFDYEPYDGGYVSFGQGGGKITGKGIIKTGKLKFENVYFVKDLKYNLFSMSQICDNKNNVFFTDSECIVLGRVFKLKDDTNVLLRIPRQHNMYSIDLNNSIPHKDLTCLVAKAFADEYMLWHKRLGHLNFKTMNRLVRHKLVRGLPSKCFNNDHSCVACLKGKQHKASCKTKLVNSVNKVQVVDTLDDRLLMSHYHKDLHALHFGKYEHNVDFHQIVDFVEASHIRIKTTDEGTKILATVDGKLRTISESSTRRNLKLNDEEGINTLPDAELFENLALMGYNILPIQKFTFQKGFNEFSSNIATAVGKGSGTPTEPHHTPSLEAQQSPLHDSTSPSHPTETTTTILTVTPTDISTLRQYSRRATRIAQSKAFPTAADEPASPSGDDSQGKAFPIVRIKMLEDKDGGGAEPSGDDAPIKGRNLETEEEAGVEKSTERGSNDTEELIKVLTSMDAVNILTSGVQAVSVPPVTKIPTVSIPTGSGMVPTASPIFTTASVVTPYLRRKGKEKMVESDTPRKKKLQEQIDVQDYKQAAVDLTIGEKIDLINELVKYQDHHAKILKYQAQQSKPISKKQQREFYMSVLKSHSGWKTKHFKGMTLEEIREKFILVWKQIEDFVPMALKEEGERFKRKGLRLEQGSAKKMKTTEDVLKKISKKCCSYCQWKKYI